MMQEPSRESGRNTGDRQTNGENSCDEGRVLPDLNHAGPFDGEEILSKPAGREDTQLDSGEPLDADQAEGSQLPPKLRELARDFADVAQTAVSEGGDALGRAAKATMQGARRAVHSGLERIGPSEAEERGVVRMISEILPGIAADTSFTAAHRKHQQARQLLNNGFKEQGEEMLSDSRRECMRALHDLGIDISALGSGSVIPSITRASKGFFESLQKGRIGRALGAIKLDPADRLASAVAQSENGRKVADYLLESDLPSLESEALIERLDQTVQELEKLVNDGAE